jgi:ACS family hexuronate transporter-like MFS transporter
VQAQRAVTGRWWKWQVCGFLLLATALSYIDRQALSVTAPVVRKELSIDNAQLGLLLSAFFYSYAAMHLFVGFFLDRFNIRFIYAGFVACWSVAQVLSGLAQGFQSLFAARVGLGVFEAAAQPGAARIIARIVPKEDRTLANGIMMSGGSIGAMIAPIAMIWLTNTVGWRTGFVLLGLLGLVWAAAWTGWFRPPAAVLKPARAAMREPAETWGRILRNPRFWACACGAACGIPILHISSAWIPTYFVQTWDLPLSASLGAYLFLIYLGLDAGFLGGGAAVSALVRRGHAVGRARKIVLSGAAVLMLSSVAVPSAPAVPAAVALVFLLNAGRAAYGAIFLAFNQDIAPGRVGTIAGVMGAIGAFSGALLVWGIGVVSKTSGFGPAFLLVGVLALAGAAPLLLAQWDRTDHA